MRDKRAIILIVDDEPLNLKLLKANLLPYDFGVIEATGGKEALERAAGLPDLILLDIIMPEMDGIEVCQELKRKDLTRDIPVIFLSALDDTDIKTEALEAGGVDFINKPFNAQELIARVKNHLTIRNQELQLKEYAYRLEQMVEERTQQLIHSDRLAALGTLSASLCHEINNANASISGNLQLTDLNWNMIKDALEKSTTEGFKNGDLRHTVVKLDKYLNAALEGSRCITRLTAQFKNYSRKGETTPKKCKLIDIINDAVNLLEYRLKQRIDVHIRVPHDIEIRCFPQDIAQVFVNLFNNAIDALDGTRGIITVDANIMNGSVRIRFKDNGPGISKESAAKIFEPFYTTKGREKGTGLGLFIVRNIIDEHNGVISLSTLNAKGTEFSIVLPTSSL